MTKQKAYISYIISNLRKGKVEWKVNAGLFQGKFGLKEDTFNKYWKLANSEYKKEQEAAEKAKRDAAIETEKEGAKRDILTKLEAQEILTKIARGISSRGGLLPSDSERIQAIKTIATQEGWEASVEAEAIIIRRK